MRPTLRGPFRAALLLSLFAARAHAQGCGPCPPPALFMAYESDSRSSGVFRGLVDPVTNACAVDTNIKKLAQALLINGPLSPVTIMFSATDVANFDFGFHKERWTGTGLLGGDCFDLNVTGFSAPPDPIVVTDGCGDHLITVGKPAFACVVPGVGLPGNFTFICFESKNVNGNNLPLPPGFDRPEDVCAVIS